MRIVLIFFCMLLLAGCTDNERIPSDIFPKEKMEKILWDMILAERFSSQYIVNDSASRNVKLETMKLYEQVFQANNTTRAEFVKSYKYYLNRPDITKSIFDSLAVRGNRNRDSLYKSMK